ncbi:protein of unknown function [Streptomyces sp. cf386]|uniref:DUF397 domain-containing protein n=1 Tax=Streptomyces sp. cf386 TaxID=1761904 RepID=UPI00088540FA|nr:DUF397 domain-containing protein [Streptomyces sp. cf386]SDM69497.1 protein of unknown function [Streptomyces sp. cf386]
MIRKASAGDASELAWFKSSYSGGTDGNSCVEVALDWFKSSYSSGTDGESCVEIATTPATIHVRDSKYRDTSPRLALAPQAWSAFVAYTAEG